MAHRTATESKVMTRRTGLLLLAPLAFTAVTLFPGQALADKDGDDDGKKKRQPSRGNTPARPAPVVPASNQAAAALIVPQGTERMVSDAVVVAGADGSGAGPVRVDLQGARPATAYQVLYVPQGTTSVSSVPVSLGVITTDARGVFQGQAPTPLPALPDAGRLVVQHTIAH